MTTSGAGSREGRNREGTEAFRRGLAAFTQYVQREQRTVVPRQHTEQITIDGHDHDVRLGVRVSNQKPRRDRLSSAQLTQLTESVHDLGGGRHRFHGSGGTRGCTSP
ncbi:helicase associated domain-containing protein [Streptomyces sp. NPDC050485]|uniref:helicase associated domain-containing protein n=1 Tax=Streptomyces sp. NPDC050485 TaxID=3365617 RepID=UPI0037989B54